MIRTIHSKIPQSSHGVTLIELIVVLAIIVTLVSLSIAYVIVNRVSGAARMIYYDLQYARIQAIAKRHNFRVLFTTSSGCHFIDGHTYKIHEDSNGSGTCDAGENMQTKDIHQDFKKVFFLANRNITFNSIGTCNGGTVMITDGKRIKKVITLWTGRVRIE